MTEITYDILKDYLLKIAAEQGDTTAACFYSREALLELEEEPAATPCCIVGQMVFDFSGVEGLQSLSEGSAVSLTGLGKPNSNAAAMLDQGFTPEAIDLASRVQWAQDRGMTWRKAVECALAPKFSRLTSREFVAAVVDEEDAE